MRSWDTMVYVPWTHKQSDTDCVVTLRQVSPGYPGSRWEPAEGAEWEVLAVVEDDAAETPRPDLLEWLESKDGEADLEMLMCKADEILYDALVAQCEDEWDARREEER